MVIFFQNEKALKFLIKEGQIITYRRKKRKEGLETLLTGRGKKGICKAYVDLIIELPKYIEVDLIRFRYKSGFKKLDDWIEAIKELDNKRRYPEYGYLYQVTLVYEDWIRLNKKEVIEDNIVINKRDK